MSATSTTTISDVHAIAVHVADQETALAFYVDTLGFDVRLDAQITPDMRWLEVGAPNGTVTIALQAGPANRDVVDTGIRFAASDGAHERERLQGRGVAVGDLLIWDGVPPMFTFDDPDANRYVIVELTR